MLLIDIVNVVFQLGVDTVRATNMTHTMKWVMRIMPLVIFPFIINFPAVSTHIPFQCWNCDVPDVFSPRTESIK